MKEENNSITETKTKDVEFKLDETKPIKTQVKEYIDVLATQRATSDESFANELTETKKQELNLSAETNLKAEKAENKKVDVEIQKANFQNFEGVATYAGIKKPLPNLMQKILFSILATFQVILLVVIGLPTSLINILADCIDSIVIKIAKVTKSSRVLLISLISICCIMAIVYIIWQILEKYNVIG